MLLSVDTPQGPFPHFNPAALDETPMRQFPQEDIIKAACPTASGSEPRRASARRDDPSAAEPGQTTCRKRSKMSNEGKEVWEMTEEQLQNLNDKWVYWWIPVNPRTSIREPEKAESKSFTLTVTTVVSLMIIRYWRITLTTRQMSLPLTKLLTKISERI